ncbi:hypothetical protein GGS24DRAFT_508996 [Hypoxylon argillaceum]|nr:hypothetical protein GGS24DRAFT_508996 [Hypoxylon argillaceum]
MRSFVSIIEDTNRSENGILLMRLRLERAKLETTAQLLSWFDPTDSRAYAMHKTAHSLMENLAECLSILDHHRKLPSRNSLNIKLTPVGTEELQVMVMEVSVLNDYLLKVVQSDQELDLEQNDQIAISMGHSTPPSAGLISERIETDHKEALVQEYTTTYTRLEHPKGQLLERLVKFYAELLTRFSNEQPECVDVSNQFRLWGLAVKSEYLYKALDHDMIGSRNIHVVGAHRQRFRKNAGRVVFRAREMHLRYIRIHVEVPSLPQVGMKDFSMMLGNKAESTKAALRTVEDLLASEVVRLLDASVDLIEPASHALTEAANLAVRNKRTTDGVTIDLELIQRVFDEQATVLRKWKEKHRKDIEVKLVEKSPAKLASVADAIENIINILMEFPTTLKSRSDLDPIRKDIDERMKGFEASVQSLVNLERQLDSIDAPPLYRDITRDRVIISVTGALVVDQETDPASV